MTRDAAILRRPVTRVTGRSHDTFEDALAVERPLQMRVAGHDVAVTLRTPGHDRELALGFLANEQVLAHARDVSSVVMHEAACSDAPDTLEVTLAPGVPFDWTRLERHFAATAACGPRCCVRSQAISPWQARQRASMPAFWPPVTWHCRQRVEPSSAACGAASGPGETCACAGDVPSRRPRTSTRRAQMRSLLVNPQPRWHPSAR